jgi:hypothetical protein
MTTGDEDVARGSTARITPEESGAWNIAPFPTLHSCEDHEVLVMWMVEAPRSRGMVRVRANNAGGPLLILRPTGTVRPERES